MKKGCQVKSLLIICVSLILQLAEPLVWRGHAGVGKDRFPHMIFSAGFFSTDKTYLHFIKTLWDRLLKHKVKKAESWRKWVSAFLRTTQMSLKAEVWCQKKKALWAKWLHLSLIFMLLSPPGLLLLNYRSAIRVSFNTGCARASLWPPLPFLSYNY